MILSFLHVIFVSLIANLLDINSKNTHFSFDTDLLIPLLRDIKILARQAGRKTEQGYNLALLPNYPVARVLWRVVG